MLTEEVMLHGTIRKDDFKRNTCGWGYLAGMTMKCSKKRAACKIVVLPIKPITF